MSDGNGTNGHFNMGACDKHPGVAITFQSADCPLCVTMRSSEALATAAVELGMVLVKLHVMAIPFALAMPQQFASVGQAATQQIQAAMEKLDVAITGGEKPKIAVARSPIVVPR